MKVLNTFLALSLLCAPAVVSAKQVLIVVTNHAAMGDTEATTGYFLSEVAHPWHVFTEAGFTVHFASPSGGFAPMDPKSFDLEDPINRELWHRLEVVQSLVHTRDLGALNPDDYAAIFFAGGHGTMWDFPESEAVARQAAAIYEKGGVIAAVCHGPAALLGIEIDGKPLVAGKRVAGFTNAEEEAVQLTEVVPFLLESKLREQGANFVPAPNFQTHVVVDQRLVTGQNPASATQTAKRVVELLQ